MKPLDHRSVMSGRREPPDSLDYFPTPPWATRALCVLLQERGFPLLDFDAWDPACGEGHMTGPLADYFGTVFGSDVFDYGKGFLMKDFLEPEHAYRPDWIITNPPFKVAGQFAERAYTTCRRGCAMLVRTSWLEGTTRHNELFGPNPPSIVAQFCERVPMVKGRWDPAASTATSYCWVVWFKKGKPGRTDFVWIPPGTKARCTRPEDAARYGIVINLPLLDEASA